MEQTSQPNNLPNPHITTETENAREEATVEAAPKPTSSVGNQPQPPVAAPPVATDGVTVGDDSTKGQPQSDNGVVGPATAADVDVIEGEWVKKAEEVIKKNSGQPHEEEEGVEDLQVDYIQKRYGKTIKNSEDS